MPPLITLLLMLRPAAELMETANVLSSSTPWSHVLPESKFSRPVVFRTAAQRVIELRVAADPRNPALLLML